MQALTALLALALAGCVTEVIEPKDVIEPEDLVGIAEDYCAADPTLPCGKVYQFDNVPSPDNPLGLLELCVPQPNPADPLRPTLEQAIAMFGPARLSTDPRFDDANLCWHQCPSARGCNSYNGCLCL